LLIGFLRWMFESGEIRKVSLQGSMSTIADAQPDYFEFQFADQLSGHFHLPARSNSLYG